MLQKISRNEISRIAEDNEAVVQLGETDLMTRIANRKKAVVV